MPVYACSQKVVITGDSGGMEGNAVSRCRQQEGDQTTSLGDVTNIQTSSSVIPAKLHGC